MVTIAAVVIAVWPMDPMTAEMEDLALARASALAPGKSAFQKTLLTVGPSFALPVANVGAATNV